MKTFLRKDKHLNHHRAEVKREARKDKLQWEPRSRSRGGQQNKTLQSGNKTGRQQNKTKDCSQGRNLQPWPWRWRLELTCSQKKCGKGVFIFHIIIYLILLHIFQNHVLKQTLKRIYCCSIYFCVNYSLHFNSYLILWKVKVKFNRWSSKPCFWNCDTELWLFSLMR